MIFPSKITIVHVQVTSRLNCDNDTASQDEQEPQLAQNGCPLWMSTSWDIKHIFQSLLYLPVFPSLTFLSYPLIRISVLNILTAVSTEYVQAL